MGTALDALAALLTGHRCDADITSSLISSHSPVWSPALIFDPQ